MGLRKALSGSLVYLLVLTGCGDTSDNMLKETNERVNFDGIEYRAKVRIGQESSTVFLYLEPQRSETDGIFFTDSDNDGNIDMFKGPASMGVTKEKMKSVEDFLKEYRHK
jgi:hypothetical protein